MKAAGRTRDPQWTGSAVVIGGTGFLGGHLAGVLARGGWDVIAVSRAGAPVDSPGYTVVQGDRKDRGLVSSLLERGPDLWLDAALFHGASAEGLVASWDPSMPTRFVIAGTIAEYGLHHRPAMPLREDGPLDPEGRYGEGKVVAFTHLRKAFTERGFPFTWAVLPQLWGEWDPHGRDATWIRVLEEDRPVVVRGDGLTTLPDGYVGTAARAMIHLAGKPDCLGRRVNVCGPESLTPLAYVREAARALGKRARVLHVDPDAMAARESGKDMEYRPVFGDMDVILDTARLDASGFCPEMDWKEGVARTARWHAERGGDPAPEYEVAADVVAWAEAVGTVEEIG